MNDNLTVNVRWKNQNGFWWNETCAMVLEHFGLPGDRYTSHPTDNNMKFVFNDIKDADLCRILLLDRC